jgi:hypothetical protein
MNSLIKKPTTKQTYKEGRKEVHTQEEEYVENRDGAVKLILKRIGTKHW